MVKSKSIMHKFRIEYMIHLAALILAMLLLLYSKIIDSTYLAEASIFGLLIILFVLVAGAHRKSIHNKARKKAVEFGLEALSLYEMENSIYEAHIDPKFSGGLKELYRACKNDGHKLANSKKDMTIYLTTHTVILKQWQKIMNSYSYIKTKEIEKLDKLAGLSPFQWYFIQKQLFGQQKKKAPKRGEWKTLETIIRKEPDDGKKDNPE